MIIIGGLIVSFILIGLGGNIIYVLSIRPVTVGFGFEYTVSDIQLFFLGVGFLAVGIIITVILLYLLKKILD
ncbi:MAG: hypothetical protein ACFFDI_09560 [Promethearchaeota archaeon]